jgi:hypothetical protein
VDQAGAAVLLPELYHKVNASINKEKRSGNDWFEHNNVFIFSGIMPMAELTTEVKNQDLPRRHTAKVTFPGFSRNHTSYRKTQHNQCHINTLLALLS